MAWPNIDPTVPLGTEKKKFGDDRIREAKQHLVDGLQAISNYSPGGTAPALRTAVWTTATRPTGANLVDRVTGYNTDLGYEEYYDAATESWKSKTPPATHAHTGADGSEMIDAADIINTPAGNIAATTVQAAINELDAEKAKLAGDSAQTFSVADATAAAHALALGQLLGSVSANGYIKIPVMDGSTVKTVIIQWGFASGSSSVFSVTFPISFPNACLSVVCSSKRTTPGEQGFNYVNNITTTGFTITLEWSHPDSGYKGYWIAIGY